MAKTQTILVAGDLIRDHNLVQHPEAPASYLEPMRHTVLHQEAGGAWYLKDLIDLALPGSPSIMTFGPRRDKRFVSGTNHHINNAFTIWTQYERLRGNGKMVWRIWRFLGCQRPMTLQQPVPFTEDPASPDLLVIDDLALGFRYHKELWPAALLSGRGPGRILVKTSLPPDDSPLWKELLKKKNADRLTVVISADALRSRDAGISRALSWDKTIEETVSEFEEGASADDLALCRRAIVHFGCGAGAASFSRLAQPYMRRKALLGKARFERFIYHPENLEGTCQARMPGQTFGASSVMAAAIARHLLDGERYSLFLAVGRALEAMRSVHEHGAEIDEGKGNFSAATGYEQAGLILNNAPGRNEPAAAFSTAFPHEMFSGKVTRKQKAGESDLLRDLTGFGLEYVAAKATDVVLRGPMKALRAAPRACYGKYLTVDREEIERINSIRSLIMAYQANAEDRRPLSIAVFGPPGTGKSFAIKQLAAEIFEDSKGILEFNLSQLDGLSALHEAFHEVRDATVKGRIPLVFWDEFDSAFDRQPLGWLKEFLAPMQDAEFRVGGLTHPLGKAIFIFAGGTRKTFEGFNRSGLGGSDGDAFRDAKGPDFVSRLRGFVNIKGPNPVSPNSEGKSGAGQSEESAFRDPAHLIRRAVILRSAIERLAPHLIDSESGRAEISTSVIRGFLRAKRYMYGARSLEAVVNMSSLDGANHFGVANLPAGDLLKLHVSDDFMPEVKQGELEADVVEVLADSCYEAWRKVKVKQFPDLKAYGELDESERENNRLTARLTQAKLHEIGYQIVRSGKGLTESSMKNVFTRNCEKLMEIEHDIWLQNRLLRGFEWTGGLGDEDLEQQLFLNRYIEPFHDVSEEGKNLDRVITLSIPTALWRHNFTLEKCKQAGASASRRVKTEKPGGARSRKSS